MTASFVYAGDFLTRLTTPYGATTFRKETDWQNDAFVRFIEAIDPLGGIERVEYRTELTTLPDSVPTAEVPTGFADFNGALDQFVSLYWNKRAMALAPHDPNSAVITSWLTENLFNRQWLGVGVPRYVKRPLQGRIWYAYPNQNPFNGEVGSWIRAEKVARVLDDGTSQIGEATYNDHGNVTSRTDPLGRKMSFTYAANGIDLLEVRQTTGSQNDLLTTYGNYNAQHLPQTITDAAGQSVTITYNTHGQPLTVTNAKNETTTYTYDAAGHEDLLSVTGPVSGATTTYTYDAFGRVRTITADGYTLTRDYDALNRLTRITHPDGTFEEQTYATLDVVATRDRAARITRYTYDALRRSTSTRDSLGRTVTLQWCGCGSLDAFVDGKGQRTSWERDLRGRPTREVRADNLTATVYTYEAATGRLKTMTDPKLQVTTFTYNLDDAVQSVAYTNAQVPTPSVSYTYDAAYGRVATLVDGTGTTAYSYHPVGTLGAGQVASIDGPLANDTVTYTYDELGRVTTRSMNGVATTATFDALSRVTTEVNGLGTFMFGYDGTSDRLISVSYPNGQTSSYTYFGAQGDYRLQTIHNQRAGGATLSRFDYTYDAVGNILTWQQQADSAAPVIWRYGYDAADQLVSAVRWSTGATPAVLARYAYAYDPAGNRTTEQIDDSVTESTFDRLNRLVERRSGGPLRFAGSVSEPATVTIQGRTAAVASPGVRSMGPSQRCRR